MIRTITYASCYVYSPLGTGAVCERSRLLCTLLKQGNANFMLKYAFRVRQQTEAPSQLAGFFRATDLLVPVPGSIPCMEGGAWTAGLLAAADGKPVSSGYPVERWRDSTQCFLRPQVHPMKVRYFADTDTLLIEFRQAPVAETRDLDENTALDVDAEGNICCITVEHASERAGAPHFTYEEVAA